MSITSNLHDVECLCPRCRKTHLVNFSGYKKPKSMPRIYCPYCATRIGLYDSSMEYSIVGKGKIIEFNISD